MQSVAEARPEVNQPVKSQESRVNSLACHKCHAVSIPAPEGATTETKFVCADCSPLGPEEVHFDRCQFDDCAHADAMSKEDLLKRLMSDTESIVRRRRPASLARAIASGEKWAIAATPERINTLPPRARLALLLTKWCDLTLRQAAEQMGIHVDTVKALLDDAKKKIVSFTPTLHPQSVIECDGKPKRKPASRRANSGTDGRRARFQHVERNERRAVRAGAGLAPAEAGNATHFAASA